MFFRSRIMFMTISLVASLFSLLAEAKVEVKIGEGNISYLIQKNQPDEPDVIYFRSNPEYQWKKVFSGVVDGIVQRPGSSVGGEGEIRTQRTM